MAGLNLAFLIVDLIMGAVGVHLATFGARKANIPLDRVLGAITVVLLLAPFVLSPLYPVWNWDTDETIGFVLVGYGLEIAGGTVFLFVRHMWNLRPKKV